MKTQQSEYTVVLLLVLFFIVAAGGYCLWKQDELCLTVVTLESVV